MAHTSSRIFFDSLASSAQGLLVVLQDARESEVWYSFGPLSAKQILVSGLVLTGELDHVLDSLDDVTGSVRYDD